MIYQIHNKDVYDATLENGKIICWSMDGAYALISCNTILSSITIIEQFDDSELHSLLSLPLWRQPCPSC